MFSGGLGGNSNKQSPSLLDQLDKHRALDGFSVRVDRVTKNQAVKHLNLLSRSGASASLLSGSSTRWFPRSEHDRNPGIVREKWNASSNAEYHTTELQYFHPSPQTT